MHSVTSSVCIVSRGGGKILACSAPTRHELIKFKGILIISLLDPECTRRSKILYLILLKFFEHVQAISSPLLLLSSGNGGQELCRCLVA